MSMLRIDALKERPAKITRQWATLDIKSIKIGKRFRREMGDIEGLARSIDEVGLLQPIVVGSDNVLIAGKRRILAFELLKRTTIPARIIDIEHLVLGERAENIDRQDFTIEERICIGEACEKLLGERRGRPPKNGEKFPEIGERTRDIAAKKAGFKNGKTYEHAKAVRNAARENPKRHGKALADMNRTGRVNGPYKRIKVAKQADAIRAEPPPLPGNGPYRVIIADPPWPYEIRKEDPSYRATHPFPQMSIEQICAVKVASIAGSDCILWLWTTNHHMRQAFVVLDAWGFIEKTILTWAKDKMGYGDWLRGQTEHCILAVRGKPIVELTNQTTLLHGTMRENSQKPVEFYNLVEKLCPAPRYAELFSRYQHDDKWDCHGDEVGKLRGDEYLVRAPRPEKLASVVRQIPQVQADLAAAEGRTRRGAAI
jgi:N6-adenosine-specific RNA methylase IME4